MPDQSELVTEFTQFFETLNKDYGFAIGISEMERAILSIPDLSDSEGVLYTLQSSLCRNQEQFDKFVPLFCQNILHYDVVKEQKSAEKIFVPVINESKVNELIKKNIEARTRLKARLKEKLENASDVDESNEPSKKQLSEYEEELTKHKEKLDVLKLQYDKQIIDAKMKSSNDSVDDSLLKQLSKIEQMKLTNRGVISLPTPAIRTAIKTRDLASIKDAIEPVKRDAISARTNKKMDVFAELVDFAANLQKFYLSVRNTISTTRRKENVAKLSSEIKNEESRIKELQKKKEQTEKDIDDKKQAIENIQLQLSRIESEIKRNTDSIKQYHAAIEAKEKEEALIKKQESMSHREVFKGGHNSVQVSSATEKLLSQDIDQLSQEDIDSIALYIRTNAKYFKQTLRAQKESTIKHRIDVKETIRKSMQTDGEVAKIAYKKPYKSHERVVLLSDISGSCRNVTALALTYMGLMGEVFPGGCYQFVFVNDLIPVDYYFKNYAVNEAVDNINKDVRSRGIYSDYGRPIRHLVSDYSGLFRKDTTVIIIGDARGNRNSPEADKFKWICEKTKNCIFLNPEPENKWNINDSVIGLYEDAGAKVYHIGTARNLIDFLNTKL